MRAYACYNRDDAIRLRSSSGGIYYSIAKGIIDNGGVVYAAVYDNLKVIHKRIATIEEIEASCGSKYIPSNLGNTFRRIKEDLKRENKVLFVGTPCQCGGLLSFIGENTNLYCIDFVCHGIPSQRAWNGYLKSVKEKGMEIKSVQMRDKSSGWLSYNWKLTDGKGKIHYQNHTQNAYMNGFIADLYLRPSCYNCKFKGIHRETDITLGDFWGVQNIQPQMYDNKGTSLVLLHTKKGQDLFKYISNSLVYEEAILEQAMNANPSINVSAKLTSKRKVFFKRLNAGDDFMEIIEDLMKLSMYDRIKRWVKRVIKKLQNR